MSSVLRVGMTLAAVAVAAAGLVAGTQQLTESAIQANRRADRRQRLHELIPERRYTNRPLEDTIRIREPAYLGTPAPVTVYRARRNGRPVAAAFRVVAPDGYNGPIELLVAIRADARLMGVRVMDHRETPGLGDGIESAKSDWIQQFLRRGLDHPPPAEWRVAKDGGAFEALTGATITSRAVIGALRRALELFRVRKSALFARNQRNEVR